MPGESSKAEQARHFARLCASLEGGGVPDIDKNREALRKRLERARKFHLLVSLFGTWVLDEVPAVSVSHVDGVGLKYLQAEVVRSVAVIEPEGGARDSMDAAN